MEELNTQKISEENLQGKELYEFRKKQKEQSRNKEIRKEKLKQAPKKIATYSLYGAIVLVIVGGIGGLIWLVMTAPKLPPTTAQGHVEDSPKAHILDSPMPDAVQRHMLEHADGNGNPSIIIQYNCKKYSCESDLIAKLTELAKQYPENVYLAPNDYDGKIILTKLNQSQILDSFDEQAIKTFIAK